MKGLHGTSPEMETIFYHRLPQILNAVEDRGIRGKTMYWDALGPDIRQMQPGPQFPGLDQAVKDWNAASPLTRAGFVALPVMASKDSAYGAGWYIGVFAWEKQPTELHVAYGFYRRENGLAIAGWNSDFVEKDLLPALRFVGFKNIEPVR